VRVIAPSLMFMRALARRVAVSVNTPLPGEGDLADAAVFCGFGLLAGLDIGWP
jgi:hypothetical protein